MGDRQIHASAAVHHSAELGEGAIVGAYAIVGENVTIGAGTVVMHHAVVDCNTRIGQNCRIFPFASIGTDPQDISFREDDTYVEIGDGNIIREFTTINRGTKKGGGVTRLGDGNYIMAYAHIGHDCQIGSQVIMVNNASLSGHVEVGDYVTISGFCGVHQFVRIGRNAYIGGYTVVLQDVLPFAKIAQRRTAYGFYGPNSIGMMRNGFARETIDQIKEMFKIVFLSDLNTTQAIEQIERAFADSAEARTIVDFIRKSKRGILKNFSSDE